MPYGMHGHATIQEVKSFTESGRKLSGFWKKPRRGKRHLSTMKLNAVRIRRAYIPRFEEHHPCEIHS
jgi:hypothetical protein